MTLVVETGNGTMVNSNWTARKLIDDLDAKMYSKFYGILRIIVGVMKKLTQVVMKLPRMDISVIFI